MSTLRKSIAFAVSLLSASPVLADNDGNNATQNIPRVVPYDGVIDFDGSGYNGLLDIVFTLYDAADGDGAVWTEEWSAEQGRAVTATGGRFSVNLGTYQSIESVIADAGNVYLGIALTVPDAEEYTALSGRQRLNPVPYALWTTRATTLEVADTLTVNGATLLNGGLTVQNGLSLGTLLVSDGEAYQSAIRFADNRLQIGLEGQFGDGINMPHDVQMNNATILDDLTIGDDLTVVDDVHIESSLRVGNVFVVETLTRLQGEVEIQTDAEITGDLDVSVDVRVADDLTVGDSAGIGTNLTVGRDLHVAGRITTDTPLFVKKYMTEGEGDRDYGTGISAANYDCFIGGVFFNSGIIDEDDRGDPMRAYTYVRDDNTWGVIADFHSESNHEGHAFGVFCVRSDLVQTLDGGGA
jgi:hypothetical protein